MGTSPPVATGGLAAPAALATIGGMTTPPTRAYALRVFRRLTRLYPDAHCALEHRTPLQLLLATILSAQCTDARVNMVTPALFARFPDARALADADPRELERLIQSTGFFRAKAKNIRACCRQKELRHHRKRPRLVISPMCPTERPANNRSSRYFQSAGTCW